MFSVSVSPSDLFFFFNDTATTEIYTLSLHDALPISCSRCFATVRGLVPRMLPISALVFPSAAQASTSDRKSTRLNSSHGYISYAVFCLKKKKNAICSNSALRALIPSASHRNQRSAEH